MVLGKVGIEKGIGRINVDGWRHDLGWWTHNTGDNVL